ncbi:glycosyltransferase [Microbulbifer variabilis]|uniref:Glycosyltransferase n=1 Tax=Microbulbifer variabilis TaxID=266805 RepID=A0ABY4VDN4_9GAMM|nr:glycosyltransferase [Microbulbifer variabilis]USD22387.1 glycosyltransferase [Microbulbifer variabilis]
MDVLLKHAEDLASRLIMDVYLPIQGRVAYVVSHGQSYASNGYSIRTQAIAKALNINGLETLCFVRPGRPWELGVKKGSINPEVAINGVRYIHSRWKNDIPPNNEQASLEASVACYSDLFSIYRPEIILAASDYTVGLPAWIVSKSLGLPFYNEVRGFWELSKAAREPGFEKTLDFQIEADRNSFVSSKAIKIFTLNQRMKAELTKRGLDNNKISIVPNCISEVPKVRQSISNLRAKLRINDDDKVVGYIGSFSSYEGIDLLIDACKKLRIQEEKIKLLLVGDYEPVNETISTPQRISNESWFIQVGRVPHELVADYYALIDTVVIPRKKLAVCELVSPIKVAEAIAFGKQLVVSDVVPLNEIVGKNKNITVFESGNINNLVKCIHNSLNVPDSNTNQISLLKDYISELVSELKTKNFQPKCVKSSRNYEDREEEVKQLEKRIENKLETLEGASSNISFQLANQDQLRADFNGNRSNSYLKNIKPITNRLSEKFPNGPSNKYTENKTEKQELINEAQYIKEKTIRLKENTREDVAQIKIPIHGSILELSSTIVYHVSNSQTTRKAVVLFQFFDQFEKIIKRIPGVGIAAAFDQHFRYLNKNNNSLEDDVKEIFKLNLPDDVASVAISVASLGLKSDEHIDIRILGRCYNIEAEMLRKKEFLKRQPMPPAIVHEPTHKRLIKDLVVACILDEFTTECLEHEVILIKITQENWAYELEKNHPNFLLVESCWKGNNNNWGTLSKGSGAGKKLSGLLTFCKKKNIPTIFWNKEDPPHYQKFGPIAKFFDVAITTDSNMIPFYKKDYGIDVYPLSFAAQPKIHNPRSILIRKAKTVFAGSYYEDKPKRCSDFKFIFDQIENAGLEFDIFDRNFGKNIKKFIFPEKYQKNIIGNLIPSEVWKAHQGYKYQVNINSVQDSETMFARRVYESLASGTPVISNDSVGVRKLFGDIVIMPKNNKTITSQLGELERSPDEYRNLSRCGVRRVMRSHTYGHRIQELCNLIGLDVKISYPDATLALTAKSEKEIDQAKKIFKEQTAQNKKLFIQLGNFESAYHYLNQSSHSITYAMDFAKKFYPSENSFYNTENVLKADMKDNIIPEALEDFIYWGHL